MSHLTPWRDVPHSSGRQRAVVRPRTTAPREVRHASSSRPSGSSRMIAPRSSRLPKPSHMAWNATTASVRDTSPRRPASSRRPTRLRQQAQGARRGRRGAPVPAGSPGRTRWKAIRKRTGCSTTNRRKTMTPISTRSAAGSSVSACSSHPLHEELVGADPHGVDEQAVARAEQAVDRSSRGADRVGQRPDGHALGTVLVEELLGRGAQCFSGRIVVLARSSHGLDKVTGRVTLRET